MHSLFNSHSRRQHEAKRQPSPTEPSKKGQGSPSPSSRGPASKFYTKPSRFKTVFNRDASKARTQLIDMLLDILSKKGDVLQLSIPVKDVDLYRKTKDVLAEYTQKARTQEAQLKKLQSDYQQKCDDYREAQNDQDLQLTETKKMLLDEIGFISCTLDEEREKSQRLEDEVQKLREEARIRSLEQCETKHSLTAELQECRARSTEENKIAASLLLRLKEKDATIENLKGQLERSSATAEENHRLQQESSFLYAVLCEAYEKIQDFLPSTEATIEDAKHALKAARRTVDEALEAERRFQYDKNIDVNQELPFVRVKRDITSP